MTRTDLKAGKKASLLLFIQTRYDMRQIYDPDSEELPLSQSVENLFNEDQQESQDLARSLKEEATPCLIRTRTCDSRSCFSCSLLTEASAKSSSELIINHWSRLSK